MLTSAGAYRLKELLRKKLIERGWRDELKDYCKEVIKSKGLEQISVEDLVRLPASPRSPPLRQKCTPAAAQRRTSRAWRARRRAARGPAARPAPNRWYGGRLQRSRLADEQPFPTTSRCGPVRSRPVRLIRPACWSNHHALARACAVPRRPRMRGRTYALAGMNTARAG